MRQKEYILTFRRDEGYPTTVLVNGLNAKDAITRVEDFIIRNEEKLCGKSTYVRGTAKFRFGEVAGTIVDIRL